MRTISRLRRQYRPEKVQVLFLAESPPESTDNEVRFFYNPRQERWDHMYRAVMAAVFPDYEYEPGQKDLWLRRFKDLGYFMIDATDTPINRVSEAERRRRLRASVQSKLSEIAALITHGTPILLVKKSVFEIFNASLREAGYNVAHERFLPFPAYGNQKKFISACRKCLRRLDRGQ